MSEQRKFPLVFEVMSRVVNVYAQRATQDVPEIPVEVRCNVLNARHACNRCEVDDCDFRGDSYNLDCEPGIDCLATK